MRYLFNVVMLFLFVVAVAACGRDGIVESVTAIAEPYIEENVYPSDNGTLEQEQMLLSQSEDESEDIDEYIPLDEIEVEDEDAYLSAEDEYEQLDIYIYADIEIITPRPKFAFVDAHADTISRALLPQHNAGLYRNNLHIDFQRLSQFDAPVVVFVGWLSDRFVADGFNRTNLMFDFFEQEVYSHSDLIEIALDLDDMERIAQDGRAIALLSIEGGEALMGNLDNVDHFFNRGVRIFAPTWNRENELGFGQAQGPARGLKPFGFEVIERIDELGIILDVSHLNMAGFWDVVNHSTRPFMASHSNAYAITPHPRNLTDDQIIAIVERDGIIAITLFPQFLTDSGTPTMSDIMRHIAHFIELGAENHIGLGSDFDGFNTMPVGMTDVLSLKILEEHIAAEFGEDMACRIMRGNFHDFFERYFRE